MRKISILLATALICSLLCACQTSPSDSVINSKNDGSFYSKLDETQSDETDEQQGVQFFDEFYSTDGSIEFKINIDDSLYTSAVPVVEVAPHILSSTDVERIAYVLFEDAVFYERRTSQNPSYSKDQLQQAISRWSQYTNNASMATLVGESSETEIERKISSLKGWIEKYTEKYDTAPLSDPRDLCDWTFRKERYYNNYELENDRRNESDDLNVIYANVEIDGIEYVFTASTRDESDYKLNTIDVSLSSGVGPADTDLEIYRAMLCRTSQPTDDQILAISTKAQNMLNNMGLGAWSVSNTYVETRYFGDIPEYRVFVECVPVFNNIPAIHGQMTPSATDNDTYAAYYPISQVDFAFSANGELIYFRFASPVDIVEIVNENVATLPLNTLVEKAKNKLMLSDAHTGYGTSAELIYMYEEVMNEELVCKIEIGTVEYGLARINVKNSDNSYYYVPTIVFKGTVNYYGRNTGTLYISSNDYGSDCVDLIWINAVDGTIITN